MSIFKKNIEAILGHEQYLVAKLLSIKENKKFEVFLDKKEPLNINIIDKSNFTPMYKTKPFQEIEDKFKKLDEFKRYPYLYFFGMGNGVLYKMLLQNKVHNRILIVEPELEILYIVLNLVDFSEDIKAKKIFIMHAEDVNFANAIKYFTDRDVKIYSKLYNINLNCEFYEKYNKALLEVNKTFVEVVHHVAIGTGNDSVDALIGLEHHIMNLPKLLETPSFIELIKKAKITNAAVLVSTGPSLTKQLPLLKEIQDNVVIVSVDASFPILYKYGIKPDIVVSMERVPDTGEFFKQTPKEAHDDVIFALSSLQHPNVINNIKAGTMQISMRPFGYTKATGPKEWGYVGIGMSAANMAFEIIYHSRFEQCIFIGQDLAYADDGRSHASGHVYGEDEIKGLKSDLYVTKYGGKGKIRTTYVWNLFRNFFEADINSVKGKILAINSTEGGAKIEGTLEIPFKEAVEKYINKSVKKEKIILEYKPKEELEIIRKEVKDNVAEMKKIAQEKLNEVKELFLDFVKIYEKLENINVENDKELNNIDFNELNDLNTRLEKVKEYFSEKEFTQIFIDAVQSLIVHQEIEIAKIVVRDVKTDKEKKIKLIDWIKAHRFWLFSLAGCMDAVLIAIDRRGSDYQGSYEGEIYNYEEKRQELKTQVHMII